MAEPESRGVEIHLRDGFVEAFFTGPYTLVRFKHNILESVRACEQGRVKLLLIDLLGADGIAASTQERFEIGRYGAEVAAKLGKVAVFGRAEQFDPETFAILVARNRGLKVQAFTDRKAAVEWLLKKRTR